MIVIGRSGCPRRAATAIDQIGAQPVPLDTSTSGPVPRRSQALPNGPRTFTRAPGRMAAPICEETRPSS